MERKTKDDGTPRGTSAHGLVDLDPAQVEARLTAVAKHLDAIDALLEDAEGLNAAERRTTARLRGDGEVAALSGILQFASAHGELFSVLAKEDDGNDSSAFETGLLLNRLQNAQTISRLAARFAAMETRVSSCALKAVALMKPTTLKAYEIAKAVADHVSHRELLFPAQDFYRANALTAARHRASKTAPAPDESKDGSS